MKITVYTTTSCQFSKAEKDYLNANKMAFEEKNLDTNKEFLQEMMTVGNNFAGTPVTRIEKDDGSIAVLKGFTKEEFDTTLGLTPAVATASPPTTSQPAKAEETMPPVVEAPGVTTPPVQAAPPVPETPPTSVVDPKLNSVLDKLEEKTAAPAAPTTPSIPDFPAEAKTTV